MHALRWPATRQAARQLWAWHDGLLASASTVDSGSSHCSSGSNTTSSSAWVLAACECSSSYRAAYSTAADASTEGTAPDGPLAVSEEAQAPGASDSSSPTLVDVAAAQQQQQPWHWVEDPTALSSTVTADVTSDELGPDHIGSYYKFQAQLVPEAFRPFHQAFYPPRPAHLQRRGGCRGLQAEFAATGSSCLMWRSSTQQLAEAFDADAAAAAAGAPRLMLRGPAGSGKSVALAALVERARARGEVALYIPDASALISGGFFYRRPEDGTYDTIVSAQHVLKSALDAHKEQLAATPLRVEGSRELLAGGGGETAGGAGGGGGGTVLDLVDKGLSTDDDACLAVECCLALVRELAAAADAGAPVLLAVDNYDALFGETGYGATETKGGAGGGATYLHRRTLAVKELNLARGFRLLQRHDLGRARVVAATTATGAMSPAARVNFGNYKTTTYSMPRFSLVEVAHLLHFYHERGMAESPSASQVEKLRAITNGSGTDLRGLGTRTAQLDTNVL